MGHGSITAPSTILTTDNFIMGSAVHRQIDLAPGILKNEDKSSECSA